MVNTRKKVTLKSKMAQNQQAKSKSQNLENQVSNYKTRIESTGQSTDKRNWLEKALNLPEDQNALFDIFELIGRPQQAVFGAIDAAQNGEDVWEGFKEGLGGSKKTSGGQLLRNAGMEGSGEFNLFDPSSYDEFSLSDVLGFGMDLFLDPMDVPLFKATKAAKIGKTADTISDATKTAQKTKLAFAPFQKGSKSTLEAGLGLVGKGVKKTAKLGDNVIEKVLGNIDDASKLKYANAVENYGAAAARDSFRISDFLGDYKNLKKNISSAVDYTKALPGDILKKVTGNKNAEQIARIQMEDLINKTDTDIRKTAETILRKQGGEVTEDAVNKLTKDLSRDLGDFIERDYTIKNSLNSILSDVKGKNKTVKLTQDGIKEVDNALSQIPLAKGTYEITDNGIKFTDKFIQNKNTILKDNKFKKLLQDTQITEAKNYTAEQLKHFDDLAKNTDFMEIVNKYQDNYKKASDIIKRQTGIDFSEITNRPGYVKKAKGTIEKETENAVMGRSSSAQSKSFSERKYASRLEAENALQEAGEKGKAIIEKQRTKYERQLSSVKKEMYEEQLNKTRETLQKAKDNFNNNMSKLDEKSAKIVKNNQALKEVRDLIENQLTDDIIEKASKMQNTALSDDLFKSSNKVMDKTKKYNELLDKFYNENLTDTQLNNLAKRIDKLDAELKKESALLESKITRVKNSIDDNTIKEIEKVSKSLDKTSDIERKLTVNQMKEKQVLEMKETLRNSYADRITSYTDRIEKLESKLRGINPEDDKKILDKISELSKKESLIDNAAGQELFDSSYTAGLREFMNSSLEKSTLARNYNDAFLEGTLFDKNVIKFNEDLEKLPNGTRKIPKGWEKVNGSDVTKNIDSFKNLLPENADSLVEFGNSVKGKTLYMPKEAAAILDVAPKVKNEAGAFVKFVNGWNNVFKRFKTLTPGFHLRNITGNASNMYLSGVPMKDIPVYYGKAISALNDSDELIRKAADGLENLTKAEQKQYKIIQEFAETGFYKTGSKIQELEDIEKSIQKGSKNVAKKGLNKVSEVSMNFNTAMDNYSRMALYMYAKDHPEYVAKLGKDSAADAVKFALFDPSNMTAAEKKYMKNIVPFYNFTKQNLLFQSSNIIKNTTKYNRLSKAINMAYDSLGEDGYYQYQKEGFQIPTPFKDSKGNRLFIKSNLPLSDLGEYMENPVQRGLSSVTPIIKAPIEKVTGKDLFTGQDVNSKNSIERVANYLGINTITTDLMKKIKAIQNSNLSDNEKWAEILRSMLQNTNEEKVRNNKLYQDLNYYQNKISSLKRQGINVPTIKELTEQSKSNLNRMKKKRASIY